jgi:DNA-binding PadR family transcriptional regulator
VLEFAILGLLQEDPLHGYELRKQLGLRLGGHRAVSYGSLYPALRRLTRAGLIAETSGGTVGSGDAGATASSGWPRRGRRERKVYRITAEGKERFAEILTDAGPQAWDDGSFGVHLAFFSRTPAETRMRILEGRRRTVEERREGLRTTLGRTGQQIDRYTRELHRLGLDSTEREVRWLNELIATERAEQTADGAAPTQNPSGDVAGDDTGGHILRAPEHDEELGGT